MKRKERSLVDEFDFSHKILPLTYGSYANKFRLVNHYAVDLEKYQVKLNELIGEYHQ